MLAIVIGKSMIFPLILLGVLAIASVWLIVSLTRIENTSKNHMIIAAAIFAYQNRMCDEHDWTSSSPIEYAVSYDDMESFDDTYKRWLDWGYTRILPPDKFEIIKPYIQDKKRKGK